MKAVKLNLTGQDRHLSYTVEAMFQLEELFGGVSEMLDIVMENSRNGFQAACKAAAILAEQGELARRHMGYDAVNPPSAEDIAATVSPSELPALKLAVSAAVSLGFGREIKPENDEVDMGLAELNEQKKTR